ncbi:hypothetical protein K469DRAFT_33604 [Zopfia rhizophila CBS 207.26]|uniref:Uncharacterized protein n=1 Tax=Zopfia rhizophila CBS 207.26 TaxID=1314779 RepID=A0A6A6DCT3_9PEZI|nr:hypothetical protein K469DRAFT_33604 [Zopfia rhizophila CBS 207.26]
MRARTPKGSERIGTPNITLLLTTPLGFSVQSFHEYSQFSYDRVMYSKGSSHRYLLDFTSASFLLWCFKIYTLLLFHSGKGIITECQFFSAYPTYPPSIAGKKGRTSFSVPPF